MNSEKENNTGKKTGKEEMEEMQMREETGKAVWYDDSLEEQSEKKNKKCTEVIEKRTACKKVFENEDHSFTAAVYPCAVHFQEKGEWKEIDNTLEEESGFAVFDTEGNADGAEPEERGWKKKAGGTKVKLFRHSKENKTVRVQRENAVLEWGLKGAAKVQGVLEQRKEQKDEKNQKDPMTLTHFSSGVVYKEVLPQIDLECLLVGDDVKDNLILKAAPQHETFTFLY